jgi:ribosomal protein L22
MNKPYTIAPKERHAKAYSNLRISTKSAMKICNAIKKKPLDRAKRLLIGLEDGSRTLRGQYYTKTVREILKLVESVEKNAEFSGLDKGRLIVHASAHEGPIMRRRRRKSAFGSRMKSTNMEVFLIERGKAGKKADIVKISKPEDIEKVKKVVAEKVKKAAEAKMSKEGKAVISQ